MKVVWRVGFRAESGMGLAPDIDSRKECSLGIRGGDLRTGKATIRNPQQSARGAKAKTLG